MTSPSDESNDRITIYWTNWLGQVNSTTISKKDIGQYEGGDKYRYPVALTTGNKDIPVRG